MPRRIAIYEQEITAGMGAVTLSVDDNYELYRLYSSGSVTLSGSASLAATGTPQFGMEYLFHYVADCDFDGNTFTIFGATIPEALESTNMYIRCYYTGSAWEVTLHPDFDKELFITGGANGMLAAATVASSNYVAQSVDRTALKDADVIDSKLATNSVTTAKITASNVTVDKLEASANTFNVAIPLSFETGEQCDNTITMPYDGTLTNVRYDVTKALAGTDAGTITPLVNGVTTTPASISVPLSSALNASVATAISAGNTFTAGQIIKMTTLKTTAGGKVIATLTFTRT